MLDSCSFGVRFVLLNSGYTIFQIALPEDLRGWHSLISNIARLQPWLRAIVYED